MVSTFASMLAEKLGKSQQEVIDAMEGMGPEPQVGDRVISDPVSELGSPGPRGRKQQEIPGFQQQQVISAEEAKQLQQLIVDTQATLSHSHIV